MSLLDFDPKASLESFRTGRPLPFSPFCEPSAPSGNGRNGTVPSETGETLICAVKLADSVDCFEERSAIREYDGGQNRSEAEAAALTEAANLHGVSPGELSVALPGKAKHPECCKAG